MAKSRKKKGPAPRTNPQLTAEMKEKQAKKDKTITIICVAVLAVVVIGLVLVMIFAPRGSSGSNTNTPEYSYEEDSDVFEEPSEQSTESSVPTEASSDTYSPPALDVDKVYYADIDIKDYGKLTVQLDQKAAPVTAANFAALAESGFYNGLTFHRIMEGFMMQGGDPAGNGTGGSGKQIIGEFSKNGIENPLSHTRGVISMARNSYNMNSASSQFFIVQTDKHTDTLDGSYAAFGKVTEGMDIVDQVCHDAKPTDDNGTIPADQQPIINSVTIRTEAQ